MNTDWVEKAAERMNNEVFGFSEKLQSPTIKRLISIIREEVEKDLGEKRKHIATASEKPGIEMTVLDVLSICSGALSLTGGDEKSNQERQSAQSLALETLLRFKYDDQAELCPACGKAICGHDLPKVKISSPQLPSPLPEKEIL